MKLKNLMENKQLDFNQPFLSVRRSSSMETTKAKEGAKTDNRWPPLPVYKSELKSGPIRKPGNVPFLWEQAPGRPKVGRKSQAIASKPPSIAPKLPPGMSSSDSKQQHYSKGATSGAAALSPTGDAVSNSDHFPSHKNTVKHETLKEKIERELNSGSEDGDEAYLEATDTLSRSESFFMNCSVNGLSGLDGADVKPSGTFSTDRQTLDLMMGRFLPAAKALASETPQAPYRKPSVQREQQREAKKTVGVDKDHRVSSLPTKFPYYAPPITHDIEGEDEDDALDDSSYPSTKDCGLFTRFCLRGSFWLLNPVPGMRMQNDSSAHRVQNDSSFSSIKNLRNQEHSLDGNQKVKLHEENSVLRGQSNRLKLDKSSSCTDLKRNGSSNDPKKVNKSLLSEGKVFPSGLEKVKNSKVHSEPHKSGRSKFRELLASESFSESSDVEKPLYVDSVHNVKYQSSSPSPLGAKGLADFLVDDACKSTRSSETKEILHLDSSSQHVQPSSVDSNRSSSKSMESMDSCSLSCSSRSYYDAKVSSKGSSLEVDLIQDDMVLAKTKAADERTIDSGSEQSGKKSSQEESSDDSFQDFASFTSSESSNRREKPHLESKVAKGLDDVEDNPNGHSQGSITLTTSKATAEGKINLESVRDPKRYLSISSQPALAPPPPKSPSESWLKRTLPTISSRNLAPQPNLVARIYATRQHTVF